MSQRNFGIQLLNFHPDSPSHKCPHALLSSASAKQREICTCQFNPLPDHSMFAALVGHWFQESMTTAGSALLQFGEKVLPKLPRSGESSPKVQKRRRVDQKRSAV